MADVRRITGAVLFILPFVALGPTPLHAIPGQSHAYDAGLTPPAVVPVAQLERGAGIVIRPPPPTGGRGEAPGAPPAVETETSGDSADSLSEERQIEVAFWTSIRDSSDPADFEAYLETYPDGAFVRLAHNRLAALAANTEPPNTEAGLETADAPSDQRELARTLQTELRRVGCNPGTPDGLWGPRSRRALEQFNRHAGTDLQTGTATAAALQAVRARSNVCPVVARQPQRRTAPAALSPSPPPPPPHAAPPPFVVMPHPVCDWASLNSPDRRRFPARFRC